MSLQKDTRRRLSATFLSPDVLWTCMEGMVMTSIIVFCTALLAVGLASAEPDWERGSYSGEVRTSWNDDHRTMTVDSPFTFTDRNGKEWHVPEGTKTDGASIPSFLWGGA